MFLLTNTLRMGRVYALPAAGGIALDQPLPSGKREILAQDGRLSSSHMHGLATPAPRATIDQFLITTMG